ncbi:ribosome biogenesis regulatory protein homolog [Anolis carolinensis]|uniref:ribosome biogenesis regulatory protein homolog n=1 Tax=Anolis carolinensis TaxID=28377 RepID=UPI002F2B78A8
MADAGTTTTTVSVEELLARAEGREAEESQRRGVSVHKELELEFDAGNLLALDRNPAPRAAEPEREASLRRLARDNTQLLAAHLWALPSERAEGGAGPVVARLPEPCTRLPREKPLPKPKPLTRWEQFARLKGIRPNRKKRGSLVWDEAAKEWRRRWGYRRAGGGDKDPWLMEVPDSADPSEDPFARRRSEKRERVARNELNRLRNLARAHKAEMHPTGRQDKAELARAALLARAATASKGRFQPRLPREPPSAPQRGLGRKRHFQPLLGDLQAEKARQLELARNLAGKKPTINIARAVGKQLREEDEEARARGKKGKKQGQRGKRQGKQQRRGKGKKAAGGGGGGKGRRKK